MKDGGESKPVMPTSVADAWAAVYIDVSEKLEERSVPSEDKGGCDGTIAG